MRSLGQSDAHEQAAILLEISAARVNSKCKSFLVSFYGCLLERITTTFLLYTEWLHHIGCVHCPEHFSDQLWLLLRLDWTEETHVRHTVKKGIRDDCSRRTSHLSDHHSAAGLQSDGTGGPSNRLYDYFRYVDEVMFAQQVLAFNSTKTIAYREFERITLQVLTPAGISR